MDREPPIVHQSINSRLREPRSETGDVPRLIGPDYEDHVNISTVTREKVARELIPPVLGGAGSSRRRGGPCLRKLVLWTNLLDTFSAPHTFKPTIPRSLQQEGTSPDEALGPESNIGATGSTGGGNGDGGEDQNEDGDGAYIEEILQRRRQEAEDDWFHNLMDEIDDSDSDPDDASISQPDDDLEYELGSLTDEHDNITSASISLSAFKLPTLKETNRYWPGFQIHTELDTVRIRPLLERKRKRSYDDGDDDEFTNDLRNGRCCPAHRIRHQLHTIKSTGLKRRSSLKTLRRPPCQRPHSKQNDGPLDRRHIQPQLPTVVQLAAKQKDHGDTDDAQLDQSDLTELTSSMSSSMGKTTYRFDPLDQPNQLPLYYDYIISGPADPFCAKGKRCWYLIGFNNRSVYMKKVIGTDQEENDKNITEPKILEIVWI